MKIRFPIRFVAVTALAVMLFLAACSGGDSGGQKDTSIEGLPPEFERLAEVWELLNREHIDAANLDAAEISDGAIRGMLQALDDPYAGFLNQEQYSLESQDIRGFFGGIGAEVGIRDGVMTILSPMPDTPAEAAGVKVNPWYIRLPGTQTGKPSWIATATTSSLQMAVADNVTALERSLGRPQANKSLPEAARIDEVRGWLKAEEESRASMLTNLRLNREIMAACKEQGR